jgi:hypothetical protein
MQAESGAALCSRKQPVQGKLQRNLDKGVGWPCLRSWPTRSSDALTNCLFIPLKVP